MQKSIYITTNRLRKIDSEQYNIHVASPIDLLLLCLSLYAYVCMVFLQMTQTSCSVTQFNSTQMQCSLLHNAWFGRYSCISWPLMYTRQPVYLHYVLYLASLGCPASIGCVPSLVIGFSMYTKIIFTINIEISPASVSQ